MRSSVIKERATRTDAIPTDIMNRRYLEAQQTFSVDVFTHRHSTMSDTLSAR